VTLIAGMLIGGVLVILGGLLTSSARRDRHQTAVAREDLGIDNYGGTDDCYWGGGEPVAAHPSPTTPEADRG
jgi:hypothetical protein